MDWKHVDKDKLFFFFSKTWSMYIIVMAYEVAQAFGYINNNPHNKSVDHKIL